MKFKAEKQNLLNGVSIAQNIINPRGALPILSNILIEIINNKLKLISTDLDISLSCDIEINALESGSITVPAKRFCDIIRELPEGEVTVSAKKNNFVTIEAENCQFKISGLPKEDFPKLPEFKDKESFQIEQSALSEILTLTSFSISHDETRYILNGMLIKLKNNILSFVTTDGRRLAVYEQKIDGDAGQELQVIIPLKTIQELVRNLKDDGIASFTVSHNQVLINLGGVTIISRLIEGEFPDYQQVIPKPVDSKVTLNRQQFLLAVKRAALLTTPDYQAVKMEIFSNKMVISKSTPDVGESREDVAIEYQGKETVIGFNPNFLVDVLKNLKEEKIAFEIVGPEKPGVVRLGKYIYVVLPMRLN